jgi:hypothetical protein
MGSEKINKQTILVFLSSLALRIHPQRDGAGLRSLGIGSGVLRLFSGEWLKGWGGGEGLGNG